MPTTPQETRTRFDDDNDGRIDRIAFDLDGDGNIDRTAHLNAAGRWERVEQDVDDDGNIDRIDHYAFAADGTRSLTRSEFDDDDADGTADRSEAYSYNSNGNRIRTRFDDDNDGRIDRIAFDVDGDGNINRTAHLNAAGRWERVEQDVDDDGNIDRIDHYAFAADGTRSLTRSEFDDDDADGTADRSEAYSYNSNGNRIRTRFDDDNDGRIDRIAFDVDGDGNINRTAHLNAAGRWERVEQDVDDDGNIDRIDHYTFAADGTRSLTRTAFDDDADGTADRSEAYSYNSNGNRIRTRFDDDNDGRIDRIAFDVDGDGNIDRTAHLNAAGRWERVEQDVDDDGNIDRIDHYAFAADGARSLTRSAFDTDGDGTADRSEAYTYNSGGTLIRTAFDPDGDGTADRIDHYTYDDDGARRVIRRDVDLDDDGNIDRTAHLNAAGRWERVEQDVDDDGNIDRIDHYAFAADGTRSLTRTAFDTDGDGTADRSEAYSYNSGGNRTRTAFDDDADGRIDRTALDNDGDGNIDRINHYTYDNDGARSVTRRDFDLDDDGTIDRTAHLNAAGRWERVEQDVDDDGNIDRIDHYAFAADGTRSLTRRDFDVDGDGNIDRSEAYSYNSNGNRIRTRFDDDNDGRVDRIAFDLDGDGNIDRTAHLNAEGRWERVERDVDDDGNIDRIDHYTFAADGTRSLTRTAFDLDGDGNIDRIDHYAFAADGTRSLTRSGFAADGTRSLTRSGDVDGDGNIDRSEAYNYNSNGNRTRTRFDDDNDGRIDRVAFDVDGDGNIDRTAHLNAAGRWERVEQDVDDDGNIDRIDHYTFDEDGTRSLTRRDFDVDGDGNIDRIDHYTFAADGTRSLTRSEFDDDGDGNIDRSEAYIHDANGNRIRTRFDDDNDGRIDRVAFDLDGDGNIDRTAHLNAAGRWERVEQDVDDDGNIDRIDHYTFAADGTRSLTRTGFDVDGDGNIDRSEAYSYNSNGNRIRTRFDDDGDGNIDRSEAYSYNSNGNRIRTRFDDDNDGRIDRIAFDLDGDGNIDRTAHLNADGRWERVEQDVDDDGNIDRIDHYAFAADGTRSLTRSAFDTDGDGTADRIDHYTYDDDGNRSLTRRDFDLDDDGNIDRIDHYAFAADGTRSLTRSEFDDDGDGNIDRIDHYTFAADGTRSLTRSESYSYDASGNRTRTAFDTDADGTADRSEAYSYDANGRVSRTRFDDDNDDTIDRSETYTYNSDGRVSRTDFDDDGDGTIDRSERVLSSLDGTNGFTLAGIDRGDISGFSVSFAGDVNGDGYDDLIIGANRADPNGGNYAGETYLVYGGASAPGTDGELDLSTLDGTNGFILNGIDRFDYSGISVSSAGDVNGDGYDDLIIGANGADPNGDSRAGETYLVYGGASAPGTDGVLDLSALDGTNGFILNGIDAYDRSGRPVSPAGSGRSVSSAGDVNGDGYDDLIIGARLADPNGRNSGETYLVYGGASAPGTDGVLDLSALDGTNGFILNGIDTYDRSGQSVSSAGDVNGDGYDDLIIGAYRADPNGVSQAGETYIVYGGASAPGTDGVLDLSDLDGSNGFILNGIDADDESGTSVSSAGDVNGDGYDDLIIGAPGAGSSGETYIVYGGASAPGTDGVLDLSTLNGTNGFILTGIDRFDGSGFSVSSAGDVNGDGYDDLIIGAWAADPNGARAAGETYIVYGGANAPGTGGRFNLSALDGTNGFILNGIDASDFSGSSVSSAGDVNGDGYDDLIIGARYADPNGVSSAGETYIVYGGATGTESLVPVTASGTAAAAADNFTGNAGADSFTDIATNDVVRGGAGDDTISVTSLDFAAIDGGTGQDRLMLDGAGLSLDLTGAGHAGVDSVEVFDLSGTEASTLVLDALAVFDLTEERAGGVASLDVRGGADDRVDLGGSSFARTGTVTEDGTTYNVYRDGNAQLRVEKGVQVQIPPVAFNSPATASVAENQVAAYEAVVVTDVDGDSLRYSLSGTDAALFTITPDTGEVRFIAAPDFEMPGDGGGDNVYDIIVTASDGTNSRNHNVAITVTNENNLVPLSSLDGTNGFILNGIDAFDQSGISVSSAGDVNGDGYDDLIIGARYGDPNGDNNAGETYVVYGGARAPGTDGVLDLSTLNGTNGFILTGIDRFDGSGFSVSSAGDVNGDGYDDLIIGANRADPNGDSNAGETYIVYGGASAPGTGGELDLSALNGTNGFILTGIDGFDFSGSSVSSAGDVNGDGYDDMIIGTRYADQNRDTNAGETYIVYGGARAPGTEGVLDLSTLDGTNGFILNGIDEDDYSGWSVSSAGDVNGDGYDDLIIGAPGADPNGDSRAGETYIVYGGASAPGTRGRFNLSTLDGTNGFILNGIDANDRSGGAVSSAGDVNGDGYDDLIIGANRADPNGGNYAGETYLVYGGARAPGTGGVLDLSTLDGSNGFILTGIDRYDRSGRSVSSAGDVNGDGYDDLIIGARYADPNGDSRAGETYIVYGGASAPGTDGELDLSDLDVTNGFTLTGIDADNESGRSVSSAGDVNGDGYDDLIIGADGADPNGDREAGETYIVYGGATGTESLVPVTASGTAAADNFTGNAGADSFTDIATNDVVRGGAGDDTIRVTSLDFAAIDGGTGTDQLILDGAGLSLDLTGAGHAGVDSVEVFDLSGTGGNTLVLDALAVFGLTEERAGGVARLDVLGDADDRVDLGGSSFARTGTVTEDGTTYNVYRDGNAQLRVEDGVQVVAIPVFTSPATVSVAENQVAAYEAVATDANGDSLVYSLSGVDAALFMIDADTGEVSFMAAPDFEAPGDADRDNVYDIIVTASDGTNQTDQPVAITVTDENELIPLSTLDGSNGFILNGIDAGDESGFSVSSAGDVNGDGYDDLIIGASEANQNGNFSGETYLVYGGASAPGTNGVLDLSTLDGTSGFILNGIDRVDYSGISVSSAGDVNGDGYDDLIIGASDADPNGSRSGETYIVYGGASAPGTGGVLDLSALNGTNGFILNGIDADDLSGRSVSSAGDVNGDGYDDLIIGADSASPNGDFGAGETYLVYGGANAPGTGGRFNLSTLDGTNGFILNGIGVFDDSGRSVSSAGDVNGDGYDDLIIGAPGAGSSGETYLVYGGASAPGTGGRFNLSALDGSNGFILNGIDRYDRSGRSVSSAGDVNGDGYDDLIIGASDADPNGSRSGETYVIYGGANAPGTGGRFNLSTLDGTNGFILNGIDRYDRSGRSVSSAGDVNGDGYDDLIIGADGADPNGDSSAGETYVVYGGARAPGTRGVLDLSDLDVSNGFTLTGIDPFDDSGISVSSAGDVNGDGYDDLIIGAREADPNGDFRAGETYIVYGGATGTESLVPVTASGTAAAAADNFTGNAGADSFTDIATNDVVRGGAGDDTISVTALDFAAVDGGTGQDRLILDGAGLSLDLTGAGHAGVDSVEVFDLSGTGANTLVLDALAVFDLTEERADGVASLDVLGGADDRVDLGGGSFARTGTVTEDGTTYNVYRDGNAQLRVETGVGVTLAATPTGSMGTGTGFGAGANGDGDPERIKDRDASGLSVRLDEDTDGDGDTDRVTYEGDADFAGNFPNNIGLEVVRLDGLDGEGGTDLTIPDEFVFAGNPSGNQVRIEGGKTDTLRFDMDDFAEAPEPVGFGGESYRSFASDDQTWSFLVDADVMLFDI